jgi:uncharacterized protein (DUF1330 family)
MVTNSKEPFQPSTYLELQTTSPNEMCIHQLTYWPGGNVNPEEYKIYMKETPATIEQFGGRLAFRNRPIEMLGEEPFDGRKMIIEFATMEQAKRWYHPAEYQAILPKEDVGGGCKIKAPTSGRSSMQ